MNHLKRYLTDCVGCPGPNAGEAIQAMVDTATDITRQTFRRHVNRSDLRDLEKEMSYERYPGRGLTMAGDWHVSYHKSTFRDAPVVYFRHSAIEYIFGEWADFRRHYEGMT